MRKIYILFILFYTLINAQFYKEKQLSVSFPHGVANQAVDILLGNDYLSGELEVTIIGTYEYANSVGIARKRIILGNNPNNGVWYMPTLAKAEYLGPISEHISFENVVWDSSLNQYKITLFHTSSMGNMYGIILKNYGLTQSTVENAKLGQVYTRINPNTNSKYASDINGTIHAKEVKVDLNGWADYVFRKEYQLPTLQDVEKHINEKGHLPNIPSENEVMKNGVNLGEINVKLLQKIEELTLYSIEQNKKIEQLIKDIEILKSNKK